MLNDKSSLLTLAKYINQEIIIDEIFRVKGETEDKFLEKYSKKKRKIKIKIIFTKIFYSVIFGIIPVITLLTYFETQDRFINEGLSLSIIIFGGNLLYSFFFLVQSLNVLFMGMIDISLILSKNLFFWLETLPIPVKRLKKLKLITILHNFDIPIIVIIIAFPIVILIETLNFVLFFICLGISILQFILSFSILIFVGNRINKSLDINITSSRKALIIRLINIFGFLIIFFGILFFIPWATRSIDTFFTLPIIQRHPAIINLILCTIPYPFSLSYLISFISITNQIHIQYWISLICGLGLFIIFDWWIVKRALKILDKTISYKEERFKEHEKGEISRKPIHINIKKPILAYFIKDFKIITRNLNVFLSVITPILISFAITYTFNFTVLGSQTPFTTDIFYNWSVILAFQPVVCGMIIYNLINIGISGESILASLPINSKDQAKAKLLFFITIQSIAIISPYLIYIFHPEFGELFISVLISLPFSWIILLSMFELYVYFFGRKEYRFVLEPVKSENRFTKWAFIYLAEYCFYTFLVLLAMTLNFKRDVFNLVNFIINILISYFIIYLSFKSMFVPILKPKKKKVIESKLVKKDYHLMFKPMYIPFLKPKKKEIIEGKLVKKDYYLSKIKVFKIIKSNYFKDHPWLSISILLIYNFVLILSINFYIISLHRFISGRFYSYTFWLCLFPTLIVLLIRMKFVPRASSKKLKIPYRILIYIRTGIIGATLVVIFPHIFYLWFFHTLSHLHVPSIPDLTLYGILTILIFAIWYEILFRGIILPILLLKYKKFIAISLDVLIFFFYYLLYSTYIFISHGISFMSPIFSSNLVYILCINAFLSILYTRQDSIYPGLILHTITTLLGVLPLFYFGIPLFLSNFMY